MTVGFSDAVVSLRRGGLLPLAALIATNVAIFIMLVTVSIVSSDAKDAVLSVLCLDDDIAVAAVRPWTLVTYSVLHANVVQLVFNMLWLYCFGRLLLLRDSGRRLYMLYFAGGVIGGIIFAVFYGFVGHAQEAMLMGASASVIAVALAVAVIMPDVEIPLPVTGKTKIKWIVVVAIMFFCIGLSADNAGGNLSHIGGALAGACYGLARRRRLQSAHADSSDCTRLVDKVRQSGYSSLTNDEKRRLFDLSRKKQ